MTAPHRFSGREGRLLLYVVLTLLMFCILAVNLSAAGMIALAAWCCTTLSNFAFDLATVGRHVQQVQHQSNDLRRRLIETERERDQALATLRVHAENQRRFAARSGFGRLLRLGSPGVAREVP